MNLQTWAEWVDQISTITGDGVVELRTRPGKGMTISVRWTLEGTRMVYNHAITMHEMKTMYGALHPCVLEIITYAVRTMTLNGAMSGPL